MARIVYRGAYATFPMVGLTLGDLAYATDYLTLYEWNGAAWITYYDYPDYEGGKRKLFTVADLAAIEATDFNAAGTVLNQVWGGVLQVNTIVAAGQTLYITQFLGASVATLAADADNNQILRGRIRNLTTGVDYGHLGGNGGFQIVFSKPIVIPGGDTVQVLVWNYANHNCDIYLYYGGYII